MSLKDLSDHDGKMKSDMNFILLRRGRKISVYLVIAKLYPLERFVGSRQCKKRRCEVCTNVTKTGAFSSTVTGEAFQINHKLNCDDKCSTYLLKFKLLKNNM